ncbi:hypothetical protein ERO13_D07G129400v2 [Gossypium hirsutum]|uniref:Uncharacterized protein n=3 Tax=Gossypium TaxID=3633 RepID=A0A5J5QQL2_GOSBA|nr:hypothetical protein ES319_D07G138900v1 [Gossypium barbadense]KAG4138360.1 hypothetical protein ERO13_D07G129400v2 [Gossypium hirsutum]TYH62820.1 hypothetical protein ES332_D07G146000v1 [Gossypium tomentosum]TYI73631.1 hypothetical protein E1A91_D07G142400v1 [Gossypium mustelinum]
MAHLSIISAFLYVFFAVALLSSSVVTVLDTELAPSPSPSPLIETGAGSFLRASCFVLCSSLIFSVLSLLRD